jgi:NAD(P)-dependent dehydrogenase (short-subunit alcohol dehydrogenase family)
MAFGPDTTTAEVLEGIDLTGRTALVTGASAGLGVETVTALAGAGARVLGAVRDREKAERVLADVLSDGRVELVDLDLADLDSVRACAKEVQSRVDALHLLVNNAGVMACPLSRTAQGFEMQLGTNHLGHFLLTTLLTDLLVAGAPARVVNVSSRGHLRGGMRWKDPHFTDESSYEKWRAYGQAKSANILFTVGLEKRLADRGVHSYALHPGVIMTELSRHLTEEDRAGLQSQMRPGGLVLKQPSAGAATQVWAATSPELEGRGGLYLEDCQVAGPTPGDGSGGYADWAMSEDEAELLWQWSEEQVAEVS